MTEQKRKIDMHVSIATKILQEIKRREIDKLQDFEEEAMKGTLSNQSKQLILTYIRRETKEPTERSDKVRLCAILA
jgi:Sec1 family